MHVSVLVCYSDHIVVRWSDYLVFLSVISCEEGKALAEAWNAAFMESSAKENQVMMRFLSRSLVFPVPLWDEWRTSGFLWSFSPNGRRVQLMHRPSYSAAALLILILGIFWYHFYTEKWQYQTFTVGNYWHWCLFLLLIYFLLLGRDTVILIIAVRRLIILIIIIIHLYK